MRSIDQDRKGTVVALDGEVAVVLRRPMPGDDPIEGQPITFDDRFISLSHLRLIRTGGGFQLEVVPHSKNPAHVNDDDVQVGARVPLRDRDRIRVGTTHLVFRTLLIP